MAKIEHIEIDLARQQLRAIPAAGAARVYPVSTARNGPGEVMDSECTPRGRHEIAEKIGNWGLRERDFTLEHFRRQQVPEAAASDHDWVLDDDEVRTITGTMGRFPGFRRVGWHILESARIFEAAS